jgi:hypothetical protein
LSNLHGFLGRIVYDYKVMQGGNLLDQGTNGLTIVKEGKIIFDGTEDTEPSANGQVDPAAIAQSFYQAYNAGDLEALMALAAEDIKVRGGAYLTGKDRFRFNMEADLKQGFQGEIGDLQVDGDTVTYTVRIYNQSGTLLITGEETLHIKDGLIYLID